MQKGLKLSHVTCFEIKERKTKNTTVDDALKELNLVIIHFLFNNTYTRKFIFKNTFLNLLQFESNAQSLLNIL
jgi:hypothetical protein